MADEVKQNQQQEKKPQAEAPKPEAAAKPAEKQEQKKEEKKEAVKLSANMKAVVDTVEKLTVIELADLVKALEDKFGVSAAAPTVVAAGGGAPGQAQGAEEKTAFTIVLTEIGSNKISVIKEIRVVTTLGLKEAKTLVESAPKTVKEDATKEEAEKIKAQLEKAGAKVELK